MAANSRQSIMQPYTELVLLVDRKHIFLPKTLTTTLRKARGAFVDSGTHQGQRLKGTLRL